ncbi:unnamed protein product [Pleuronectes platessa]|uniref:Uncharacterized protein n=1 Tax=Pleuronectes platessa TaxID=8262 RepID=A0A9N7TLD0_PLEPL|nr:unnamed protein product [Pleuronectes platessa]
MLPTHPTDHQLSSSTPQVVSINIIVANDFILALEREDTGRESTSTCFQLLVPVAKERSQRDLGSGLTFKWPHKQGTPGTHLNVDSTVWKDAAAVPAQAPTAPTAPTAGLRWGARSQASAHLTLDQNEMVARLYLRLQ